MNNASNTLLQIITNPIIGAFGLVVLLSILLAPIVLRLAGLTGAQIVDLLKTTMGFITGLITAFRERNRPP